MTTNEKDFGAQPLDALMIKLGISNNDLVSASTEQLTHKMVSKARRGRRLTLNIQNKILNALNILRPEQLATLKELFDY